MGILRVFRRQVRADIGALLTLAAILLVSATLASAFPRWLNRVEDDAIRYEVREGQEIDDITIGYDGPAPATIDAVDNLGGLFLAELEPPLDGLARSPVISARVRGNYEIATVDNEERPESFPPLFLTPRVLLVPPTSSTIARAARRPMVDEELVQVGDETIELPVVEVALSTETAAALDLEVGHIVVLRPGAAPIVLRIAGIFDPVDAESHVWDRAFDVLSPNLVEGGEGGALGEAVVTAESMPTLSSVYRGLEDRSADHDDLRVPGRRGQLIAGGRAADSGGEQPVAEPAVGGEPDRLLVPGADESSGIGGALPRAASDRPRGRRGWCRRTLGRRDRRARPRRADDRRATASVARAGPGARGHPPPARRTGRARGVSGVCDRRRRGLVPAARASSTPDRRRRRSGSSACSSRPPRLRRPRSSRGSTAWSAAPNAAISAAPA